MTLPIRLEGFALHAGVHAAVTLARHSGPLTFERGARRASLDDLRVARTDNGVTVTDDRGFSVDLIEHLLAALAGLGIRDGVLASIEGPELPILDGGAASFAQALLRLEVPTRPPRLTVERAGELALGTSRYLFQTGEAIEIEVETSFDLPWGEARARWNGEPRDFVARIAPSRTFGLTSQAPALWSHGRALLASPEVQKDERAAQALSTAVLLFDEDGRVPQGTDPVREGELARHKLLDLIGDFALYGGPPQGRVFASRPGHTASHQMIREAIAQGILSRR